MLQVVDVMAIDHETRTVESGQAGLEVSQRQIPD